jgi:hypothetical protein
MACVERVNGGLHKALPQEVREKARALVCSGLSYSKTAMELGLKPTTVSMWAWRGKWRDTARLERVVSKRGPDLEGQVAEQSKASRAKLSIELVQQIDKLTARQCPSHPSLLSKRAKLAQTLVSTADKLYGWSEQTVSSELRLDVLSRPLDLDKPDLTHIVQSTEPASTGSALAPSTVNQSVSQGLAPVPVPVPEPSSEPEEKHALIEPEPGKEQG